MWHLDRHKRLWSVAGVLAASATLGAAAQASARSPLDTGFGSDGVVVTPAPEESGAGAVEALAEDGRGRIVAAGESAEHEFTVLRYGPDGSLDRSFGGGGLVGTPFGGGEDSVAHDLAILPGGKILAVGTRSIGFGSGSRAAFVLARYDEDGRLDPGFGIGGRVSTRVSQDAGGALAVAVQSDGRILVAGRRESAAGRTQGLLIRYMPDGSVDRSFGKNGRVHFATPKGQAKLRDVEVLPSGKILVVGSFRGDFLLARLMPSGREDPRFGGGDGRVLTNVHRASLCRASECASATSVGLYHGKIIVSGNTEPQSIAIARYLPNGKLDTSFGTRGVVHTRRGRQELSGEQMVIEPDGRIVIAGHSGRGNAAESVIALRYLPDGRPDPGFGRSGAFVHGVGYDSVAFASLLQRNGEIVLGGYARPRQVKPPSEIKKGTPQYMLMRLR